MALVRQKIALRSDCTPNTCVREVIYIRGDFHSPVPNGVQKVLCNTLHRLSCEISYRGQYNISNCRTKSKDTPEPVEYLVKISPFLFYFLHYICLPWWWPIEKGRNMSLYQTIKQFSCVDYFLISINQSNLGSTVFTDWFNKRLTKLLRYDDCDYLIYYHITNFTYQ
jgi:hypothetical protein